MHDTISKIEEVVKYVRHYHKILILGGTKEAAEIAENLGEAGKSITSSLAGRTKEPRPIKGDLRIGGFGGATGLVTFLRDQGFDLLIDATHPFARQISQNASKASVLSGVPLLQFVRPLWQKHQQDHWISVPDIDTARSIIPPHARALLALGRQHIAPFATRNDVHFIIRMVDKPNEKLGFQNYDLMIGKPSANPDDEAEMLRKFHVTHIICRNSGGTGAYDKIIAARILGLPVIMIEPNTEEKMQ